jgi:hypothetical protein
MFTACDNKEQQIKTESDEKYNNRTITESTTIQKKESDKKYSSQLITTTRITITQKVSITYPEFSSNYLEWGSFYDKTKKNSIKEIEFFGENKIIRYERTDNNSNIPFNKRINNYKTVNIYVDDKGTEYCYLYNSDLFLGFRKKYDGIFIPDNPILIEEAKKISLDYLCKIRDDYQDYLLFDCSDKNFQDGYYDLTFCKLINGFKSDDILFINVDVYGEIIYCIEYDYKRYDDVKYIDREKVKNAEEKIMSELKDDNYYKYVIYNSYIGFNDNGELSLFLEIESRIYHTEELYDLACILRSSPLE